jgi:hypothetical protein
MNPLDEALKKYNLTKTRYYNLNMLYTIMTELGLVAMNRDSFTRDWFSRRVEAGAITLPRKPVNAHWRLTGDQMKKIIIAFAPGGTGIYDFRKEKHEQHREKVGEGRISTQAVVENIDK